MNEKLIADFRQASEAAAMKARISTAEARAKAQGKDFYSELAPALKSAGVPQSEIDTLTKVLADATDKNRALCNVITTCSSLASALQKLL